MANHASSNKAIRQIAKRSLINKSRLSRIKTFEKRVLSVISKGTKEEAMSALRLVQSEIMRGVSKGVLKLNAASKKVSKLFSKVKLMP